MDNLTNEEKAKQAYYSNGTGLLPFLQIKYGIGFHDAGLIQDKFEKLYANADWTKSPANWDKIVACLDKIYNSKKY